MQALRENGKKFYDPEGRILEYPGKIFTSHFLYHVDNAYIEYM